MKRAAALLFVVACGGSVAPVAKRPVKPAGHAELDRFKADESMALVLLAAADPRIAGRGVTVDLESLHHAAMGAILAEDPSLGVEPGEAPGTGREPTSSGVWGQSPHREARPDVLSFDARGRAIDKAAEIVAKWTEPPNDTDYTSTFRPEIELELLRRTVALEKLRLADERALPRSASVLLGAFAATWRPLDVKDVSARDEWLSKRLDQVVTSLASGSLTALERDELDDALDPLEHVIAEALPKSRQALVRLRLAVQNVTIAPHTDDRWASISQRLYAATGSLLSAETLLALMKTEVKLTQGEMSELVVKPTDEIAAHAGEAILASPTPCHDAAARAGAFELRNLEPPPERAFDCPLRAHVIAARTADEVLDLLIGMEDTLIAASWAVILARGGDAEAIALAAPKPVTPMSPVVEGKLLRFAATHPVEAIARALSVEWLMRRGLAQAALRAQAWDAFGDAPLDIIDREVHPEPHDRNTLKQDARVERAR